jgi:hypothetical protein
MPDQDLPPIIDRDTRTIQPERPAPTPVWLPAPRLVRVLLQHPGEFQDWPDGIVRVEGGLVWVTDPADGARVGYPLSRVVSILDGPPDAMPG